MIDCEMVLDGIDTNGDVWNRCTTHDCLVFGDAYVCEGYEPPPYKQPHQFTERDPIYGAVVWCAKCACHEDSEAAEESCPGEYGGPTDDDMQTGTPAREAHLSSWREHKETHR